MPNFSKKSNSTIENKNQNDDMKHLSFLSPHGKFVQSLLHYYINLYLFYFISSLIPTRHDSTCIKQLKKMNFCLLSFPHTQTIQSWFYMTHIT